MELQTQPAPFMLPATIEQLTPLQQGWLAMAHVRVITFGALEKSELEIQGILANHAVMTELVAIQEAIAKAKNIAETSKQQRLSFTNTIKEKIVDTAMLFEKRNETLITAAAQSEFKLRKVASDLAQTKQNKLNEEARFKAHIQNEYSAMAVKYRNTLAARITFYYTGALQQKKMNKKELGVYLQDIKNELTQIEVPAAVKFQPILLSREEMIALAKDIPFYDPSIDLNDAIENVVPAFAMYDQDIKNAEAAISSTNQQAQQNQIQQEEELQQTVATNNLMATVDNIESSDAPKIKVKRFIVEENTQAYATAVMSAFLPIMNTFKLKVKTWGNLKISQMADALNTVEKEFPGLRYAEKES